MTIVIDSREPDKIAELVDEEGGEYEVKYMQSGDFAAGDHLLERKQYGDFIGRLTQSERSIWQQVMGLEQAAETLEVEPTLILEGSWDEAMRWTDLTPAAPTNAIASIVKMGINVVHMMGPRATAQLLIKLDDGRSHDIGSIRDSPSVSKELYPRYLTESFVSVGPSRATDILNRYGSFAAVVHQLEDDPDDLKEVSGIGDATVEKMVDMVTQEWDDEN